MLTEIIIITDLSFTSHPPALTRHIAAPTPPPSPTPGGA
jgi:hypothetical protein